MEAVAELSEAEKRFLQAYLPQSNGENKRQTGRQAENSDELRPFVTLTYASSLDSMISLAPGIRTTLSGPETKSMTHYLRLHHDAILVGVGTAIADEPSLNCRYPGVALETQPRPVIVDPKMRWDVQSSKVVVLASRNKGKTPWLIHNPAELRQEDDPLQSFERVYVEDVSLQHATSSNTLSTGGKLEWSLILRKLKQKGIQSIMIEGGATIINDLLSQPGLVDAVIVTIAPTWLGQGGVTVSPPPKTQDGRRVNTARLAETTWRQFGQDAVLCGKLD